MTKSTPQATGSPLANAKLWIAFLGSLICLGGSLSFAISMGAISVPIETVWGVFAQKLNLWPINPSWSKGRAAIVWEIRFPRALLAVMVGVGLAIVGAALQAVTRNPLADPHLLGISSGGAFGAILALLHTGLFLGSLTVPMMAFLGALLATLTVLVVSKWAGATSADRLVLTGVAVSFVIMACANILIFLGDPKAHHTVVFWMLGGLGLAQWSYLIYPLAILLPCALWLWLQAPQLNAMTIGDETARSLGIPVKRFRLTVFVIGALITGVMVAFSGMIGFVGLMVPHIVRLVIGGNYVRLIPFSALLGGIFLLWADIAARTILAPEDIPVGIVTGLVGGFAFILLLRRT
jgi:iron complex transport system permease protein